MHSRSFKLLVGWKGAVLVTFAKKKLVSCIVCPCNCHVKQARQKKNVYECYCLGFLNLLRGIFAPSQEDWFTSKFQIIFCLH